MCRKFFSTWNKATGGKDEEEGREGEREGGREGTIWVARTEAVVLCWCVQEEGREGGREGAVGEKENGTRDACHSLPPSLIPSLPPSLTSR